MTRAVLVFFAGGLGCVARYLVGLAIGQRSFPYGTLIVNVIGSPPVDRSFTTEGQWSVEEIDKQLAPFYDERKPVQDGFAMPFSQ